MKELKTNGAKPEKVVDPIVLWSRDLQGKKSELVTEFGEPLQLLYKRLSATMAHYRGVGISACQIGVFVRAAIVDMDGVRIYMVNPELVRVKGWSSKPHGCLSLPGATKHGRRIYNRSNTKFAEEITVQYLDEEGKSHEQAAAGWLSHAIQHEMEHMNGKYFVDRCGNMARKLVMEKFQNFVRFTQAE